MVGVSWTGSQRWDGAEGGAKCRKMRRRGLARRLLIGWGMAAMSRVAWLGGVALLGVELAATAMWLPARASARGISAEPELVASRTRAGDHGADLTALARSVALLDYGSTVRLARRVAADQTAADGGQRPRSSEAPRVSFAR